MDAETRLLFEILADPEKIEKLAENLNCSQKDIQNDLLGEADSELPEPILREIEEYVLETHRNVIDILTRILLVFAMTAEPGKYFSRLHEVSENKDSLDVLLLEARYGVVPKKEILEEIRKTLPEDTELALLILYDLRTNVAYRFLQKIWEIPDMQKRIQYLKKLPVYVDLRLCCWKHGITREKAEKICKREEVCKRCAACKSYVEYEP